MKVQPIYRYVDPSHLGILDLDTSSISDPGMTGLICPTIHPKDGFFTEFEEVNSWDEDYKKRLNEYHKERKMVDPIIRYGEEEPFDYDYIKEYNIKKSLGTLKVCPIIDMSGNMDYAGKDPMDINEQGEQIVEMSSLFDIKENQEPEEDASAQSFVYEPYTVREDTNNLYRGV